MKYNLFESWELRFLNGIQNNLSCWFKMWSQTKCYFSLFGSNLYFFQCFYHSLLYSFKSLKIFIFNRHMTFYLLITHSWNPFTSRCFERSSATGLSEQCGAGYSCSESTVPRVRVCCSVVGSAFVVASAANAVERSLGDDKLWTVIEGWRLYLKTDL